jgi:hypothetical protein
LRRSTPRATSAGPWPACAQTKDPGGAENYEHGGRTFEYDPGDGGNKFKLDEVMEAELQLLGRVACEGLTQAWPSREGEFADKLNSGPKYVISTSLRDLEWQSTTVINSNVPVEIAKFKNETEGVILVAGSGTLVRALLENDLVGPDLPAGRVEEAERMDQPTAEEALRKLEPLIGEWTLVAGVTTGAARRHWHGRTSMRCFE